MYLNEKAWEIPQDNPYQIREALKRFLNLYKVMSGELGVAGLYVPVGIELYLRSTVLTLEKWLAESDREYRRLYLTFWQKRITYEPDEDYEVNYQNERMIGATEAYLNNSFTISLCLNEVWQMEMIRAELFSLADMSEKSVEISNVYEEGQLFNESVRNLIPETPDIIIYSYTELWQKRNNAFPHLVFCPSVEKDLKRLELSYIQQIVKKLLELEGYCANYGEGAFSENFISKTTQESVSTLAKYKEQHTFYDEDGKAYVASWHMRFTGNIAGRIFFSPGYKDHKILICYIGKKLPNVTYPT